MESVIAQVENANMLSAYNAEQGIELAKHERPDLILMDINLPGMNGIEALELLQQFPETKEIPVIAVSAAVMPSEIKAGKSAGFIEYISKPIDVGNLVETIEATPQSSTR